MITATACRWIYVRLFVIILQLHVDGTLHESVGSLCLLGACGESAGLVLLNLTVLVAIEI